MKCQCHTYHYHSKPCPNEGLVDGYCYLHHPEVMLAKLRYQIRSGRGRIPMTGKTPDLRAEIAEQERLLAEIEKRRESADSAQL